MAIFVRGDTHGQFNEFLRIDKKLTDGDICIICGDCGLLFLNDESEQRFLDDIEKKNYTILFVDGNHENFPAIYSYPEEMWNGGRVHRIRKNVLYLCRGQVFTIEGKTFFTFGGGYSIDKYMRRENVSWWKEEMPTMEEYKEGLDNLEKHNFTVDYIITHTANMKTVEYMAVKDRYAGIKACHIEEAPLNWYLEDIKEKTTYKRWFFGHFHRDWKIDYTNQRVLCFDFVKID